jgi:hypothetical protein
MGVARAHFGKGIEGKEALFSSIEEADAETGEDTSEEAERETENEHAFSEAQRCTSRAAD